MTTDLLTFLDASPVNFIVVDTIAKRLLQAGFVRLNAAAALPKLEAGSRVFVTKNDSSIYAFRMGRKPLSEAGFRLLCAHCDSPTFRIKPAAEITAEGITKLNTEVYGGPILSTWMDRPLGIAGRVILRTADPFAPRTALLHIRRPLLTIPNLAIHFNRQVNDGVALSKQKDMLPLLGIVKDQLERGNMLLNIICEELGEERNNILDFDLYLYDTTAACTLGAHNEFISAGRLDDLSMVHAGLTALLQTDADAPEVTSVLAIFDNEETGSQTKQGAGSPFLSQMLRRIVAQQGGGEEEWGRAIEHAFMVSADNAHAWHPNYNEKYDPTNHPVLGGGPVIKFNAAQKYASDAASAAVFAQLCEKAGVPCQRFVNHSDVAGGSTLGNILASSIPLRGVDMGNPILAMHSVRELGAVADHNYCIAAFAKFFNA